MSFFYERLLPKTHVKLHEVEYIIDTKADDYLVLKHAQTLSIKVLERRLLEEAKEEGKFQLVNNCKRYLFSTLTESQREKIRLDEKIAKIIAASSSPFSKVKIDGKNSYYAQTLARQVLDEEGLIDYPTPSKSKLHRLVSDYRTTGGDLSKLYIGKSSKRGKQLTAEMERLMRNIIDNHYMMESKPSISSTYRALKAACPASLHSQIPNESTLRRRIGDLKYSEVIKARDGHDAYQNHIRSSKSKIYVEDLLGRIELDAMHISLGVVDEKGIFIGYFTLYLAIDTASRMIVGYHIEPKQKLRGETPSGVLGSINSIMSDSTVYPLKDYPNPISGIPKLVVMDHGIAYQCSEVFSRLRHLGIHFENTGTKKGSGKGIIERFIRTLRLRFFREIKGYRDSKLTQKYISSKQPKHVNCVKLSELRLALEHFIYDEYANSPHSGMEEATPKQLWNDIYDTTPTQPADDVDIITIRAEQTLLTPHLQNGIRFRHQKFKSDALRRLCDEISLVRTNGKVGKIPVFYSEFDASTISIVHPTTGQLIDAFNDDPRVMSHVSFAEVNAKREKNKAENAKNDANFKNESTRPALGDNALPRNTRRRAGQDILDDTKKNPITVNNIFSDENEVAEQDSFEEKLEKQTLDFDENSTGIKWEQV